MVNFDYKLLYFAKTKEYTQYGIELVEPFPYEHDDFDIHEVVIQHFPATNKISMSVGNSEEYCVHEDLTEVHGHSVEEILADIIHLAVWFDDKARKDLDATTFYMEWLEGFNAECNEDMNIREYIWLHHELEEFIRDSVPYVEGMYYTITGEQYKATCYAPAPTLAELEEENE